MTKNHCIVYIYVNAAMLENVCAVFSYVDPMLNAPPSVTQRWTELYILECNTVRWERSKKFKAKARQEAV